MRTRILGILLVCVCLAPMAQAQGNGGHPPPPGPPGGHAPAPPPPPPGGSGGAGAGNMAGKPAVRPNVTSPSGIKLGPPGRWWDDKSFVQAIGLSKDQQKKMDAIFNANKPAILDTYKTFEKQQDALQAIGKDPTADKAKLFAAIDAANEARAALQKANTQMLLEIRQQLDAGQVDRLEKLP